MLNRIMMKVRRREKEAEQRQKEKFAQILNFASTIIQKNSTSADSKHPILDVIRMLGRRTQFELIANVLQDDTDIPPQKSTIDDLFFPQTVPITKDSRQISDFKKMVPEEKAIQLKKDLILPNPSKQASMQNSLSNIGVDRLWGPWTQVNINHVVELWLPFGITWVHRGSHSIAAGIIKGEGVIQTYNVYDLSEIYDHVYCDGLNYYRKEDKSVIAPVRNVEFAVIFEIGRMMKTNNISF